MHVHEEHASRKHGQRIGNPLLASFLPLFGKAHLHQRIDVLFHHGRQPFVPSFFERSCQNASSRGCSELIEKPPQESLKDCAWNCRAIRVVRTDSTSGSTTTQPSWQTLRSSCNTKTIAGELSAVGLSACSNGTLETICGFYSLFASSDEHGCSVANSARSRAAKRQL